ncbi:MAG TPA: S9 family peptidase [Rhizomicrobium sp.]|nr:S9 family peptidase [Rhizomicrobium sp.]
MRVSKPFLLAAILATPAVAATAVLKGPPPRAITDPRAIVSTANADAQPVAAADLFSLRGGNDAAWTPDGRTIVFSTNLTGRFNLWKMSADGGFPLQLTQSDDRQSGIAMAPDGKSAIFDSDSGGGEIYDLYQVPLAGGPVVNLTASRDVSEQGAHFLPDGAHVVYVRRLATGASTDIALMDLATRKVTQLTHEATPGFFWGVAGITADGRTLVANRVNIAQTDGSIWRIDIASGKAEQLSTGAYNVASAVSADGKTLAITSETADGARQAALFDTASRKASLVRPDAWEQQTGSFSPDGRSLLFTSNVDGRTDLFLAVDGKVSRVDLPPGINEEESGNGSAFSPDGKRLLVSHQASNTPFDYWTVDLASGRAAQLTTLGLAGVSPRNLPAAQVVHYKSEDGTVISALLWVPFNLKHDGQAPGVVYAHGGPTAQTTDYFSRTVQALASRGYVVIAPNPRGSTGYGRAFMEANKMDLGGGDLVDEVYGAKFLSATGYVDKSRIGITGGSYGGYMTLMAVGKTPQLWAAAVEQYGIIDWFAMYEHEAPPLRAYEVGLLGDPVKDKATYDAASPLTYIKQATAPLLVLQGENDIRVPKEQAETVVAMLKAEGRTVDAHFYPGEGHGFSKRENQIDAIERMVAWFDKYLKGGR